MKKIFITLNSNDLRRNSEYMYIATCIAKMSRTRNLSTISSTCPCCAFLPDDLFLPSSVEERPSASSVLAPDDSTCTSMASSLSQILEVPSPSDALQRLLRQSAAGRVVTIVDTHGHPQLEREGAGTGDGDTESSCPPNLSQVSVVCAVSPDDWQSTLNYAADPSRRDTTLPALGVHPWYLYPDLSSSYLSDLESLLVQHPRAIVGEIGLCKVAKFVRQYPADLGGKSTAMELQRTVFRDQFMLAAKLRRPVSVHCVQQHGVLIKLLKEIREGALKVQMQWKRAQKDTCKEEDALDNFDPQPAPKLADAFPTAIAMHSYTGTAHHVKELLAFEQSLVPTCTTRRNIARPAKKKQGIKEEECALIGQDIVPPLFYFGFSHTVNVAMCSSDKSRVQNIETIRAVPMSRLLAESDVHSTANVKSGTAGAIAYLSAATSISLIDMADMTAKNAQEYLRSIG